MKCMNCGLPLSPTSNATNCPRCGAPLNVFQGAAQQQFDQAGWGNMGGMPQQNPWGQAASPGAFSPFTQQGQQNQSGPYSPGMGNFNNSMGASPMVPRRPMPPPKNKANPRTLFMVAGLCVVVGALILGLIAVLVFSNSGKPSPNTANNNGNSANASPTSGSTQQAAATSTANASASPTTGSASPTVTGTAYPGQQYIDGAQMVASAPTSAQPQQPTTSFKVGSNMYVTFNLHPPSTGGAVCSYWYLSGNTNPVTTYQQAVKGSSRSSYTYAIYGSAGQAYVELYWASDKTCADKVLAQHVDFTVTN